MNRKHGLLWAVLAASLVPQVGKAQVLSKDVQENIGNY